VKKHSEETDSRTVTSENMREFSIRLPLTVSDYVENAASARGLMVEQLLAELITDKVSGAIEPLDVRLRQVTVLIRELVILAKKTPLQEEKDAKGVKPALEERKKKREHMIELGLEAYEELSKIARSEEASKQAEFRMQAFMVMARMGSFNAAVIRDQEADEIARLIEEVHETNIELERKLDELEKKQKEEEEQRWHGSVGHQL